ncbi:MAG: ISL3 family transposase [Acidimicrobiia bacterium]|nr:ISL3 family transposase [Acidimicrobiia bacterium]
MCELLVGLPAVNVLEVTDADTHLRVMVETRGERPSCPACGSAVTVNDRNMVELTDLPCFGRPTVLAWRKIRWACPLRCGSFTEQAPAIAASRLKLTDRAGRWATVQVGRHGRSVTEVAKDLGCGWHPVMDAVAAYGQALVDDPARFGDVSALGLDETLRCRVGEWRRQEWTTQIVDVEAGQLLDVVAGRAASGPIEWLEKQTGEWRGRIRWATLDLSGPYRKVFDVMLPDAVQVADPFHLVRLANSKLDECRRRVQNETVGHRGRKDDPLYRARRLLTKAHERLDQAGELKLTGLLKAGDPRGEVQMTWHAKETIRSIYHFDDHDLACELVDQLIDDLGDRTMPLEVRSLGRTIARWKDQIVAWHRARVSNGPTEAVNNLLKRVKRMAFRITNFRNYRIRTLLYAGKPNWDLLATSTPH